MSENNREKIVEVFVKACLGGEKAFNSAEKLVLLGIAIFRYGYPIDAMAAFSVKLRAIFSSVILMMTVIQ